MKTNVLLVSLAALLIAGACTTTKVHSDFDRNVDFSQYKTFAFRPGEDAVDDTLMALVSLAVGQRLEAAGLHVDAADPDLIVAAYGSATANISFAQQTPWYQPDGGWNGWYNFGWGGYLEPNVVMRNVPEGVLAVDLVDARRKLLVWRGVASRAITQDPTPQTAKKRINAALDSMFRSFPPK